MIYLESSCLFRLNEYFDVFKVVDIGLVCNEITA